MAQWLVWLLGGLLLAALVALLILARRLRRGAEALERHREEKARRLAVSRRRAEVDYVLAQLRGTTEGAEDDAGGEVARRREILKVLERCDAPSPSTFPLADVVREIAEAFRREHPDRTVNVEVPADDPATVVHDTDLVRWAVREYLHNIPLHAGNWSTVHVRLVRDRDRWILEVEDDGDALEMMTAARLYAPFTPRKGSPGPGLGLYVVRRITEVLGGEVLATPTDGGGLRHRLALPAAGADSARETEAAGVREA